MSEDYMARSNRETREKRAKAVADWKRFANKMGVHIDQEAITHVLFAGEWHEVEPGTFVVTRVYIRNLWEGEGELDMDREEGARGFSFLTPRLTQVSGLRSEIKGVRSSRE